MYIKMIYNDIDKRATGHRPERGNTMTTAFEQTSFIQIEAPRDERRTALRLRERLMRDRDFGGFEDSEILTTILSYANGTKNPERLTEKLLDAFGSLKGILEARPEQLLTVDGMNATRAGLISMLVPMARVWHRCATEEPERVGNSREAENYCLRLLTGERIENFYVIAVNAKCNVLGRRKISTGSLSEVSAYPRLVMETALNYNAHSVLLSHNHPGGTCAPSAEDIQSTHQLQRLLQGVGILVLDHIIVAGDRTYSMIQHGDITYRLRG